MMNDGTFLLYWLIYASLFALFCTAFGIVGVHEYTTSEQESLVPLLSGCFMLFCSGFAAGMAVVCFITRKDH